MITIKKWFTLIASTTLTLTLTNAAQAQSLRLGHVTPPSHIWHKVAERFDQNLQQATQNQDSLRIYPLSKLGGDNQMIAMLQAGSIQFAILTAGSLSNRSESMNAWFMPYTFRDVAHAAEVTQSDPAQAMLADLKAHKLVGLGYTLAGMRHVLSTSEIKNLNDFSGKKIRSFPNKIFNQWWSDLGAAPTALAIGDVSPALTTNLLDGVDVDLDIVVGLKMYQQAPYLTLTNHMAFPGVVVASEKWWSTLSSEKKQLVKTALKEAESWGYQQQIEAEEKNLAFLKSAGVKVGTLNSADLQQVGQTIRAQYTQDHSEISGFLNSAQR